MPGGAWGGGGGGFRGGNAKTNPKVRAEGPGKYAKDQSVTGRTGGGREGTLPARGDMRIGARENRVADHEGAGSVGRA